MGKGDYLGEFEHLVLLALAQLDDNAYGVTIRRLIEERTGRPVAIGAVYATLDRLVEKRYVTFRLGEKTPVRGGRAKKLFRLEAAGVRALRRTREMLSRMGAGITLESDGAG